MAARELQEQAHQAHPAGAHLDTHQVDCQDQPMQEGETRHTLEKRHDGGTRIEALLLRPPRLQRRAGHLKHRGGSTLGDAPGW